MKKNRYLLLVPAFAIGIMLLLASCKKSDTPIIPTEQAHFINVSSGTYQITGVATSYKIPIGITTVSENDRTISVSITSPTGAVQGTHYNISSKALIIPAGKSLDSLTISGVFSQYQAGRKDTLVIKIDGAGVPPADFNNTFTLAMRGPCFEGEIANDFAAVLPGTYPATETGLNANGTTAYTTTPYNVVVKNVTRLTATTVEVTVSNIYEVAAWEAKFTLDFTDLTSRKITTTTQRLGPGSAVGLAAYDIFVEPPSATQNLPSYGDFTFCQNAINLKFRLGARSPSTGALVGYLSAVSGGGTGTFIMALKR